LIAPLVRPLALTSTLLLALIAGCTPETDTRSVTPTGTSSSPEQNVATAPDARSPGARSDAVLHQTVYVPAYSHIFFQNEERDIDLATTLSVRNTDPENAITVTSIRYHDSGGQLVRRYGEGFLTLPPLASRAYVVDEQDRTGGVGANFLAEWEASAEVSPPIVEAVMISTAQSQGISFVSRGRIVRPLSEPTSNEIGVP
jgi:hypothetical protein